MFSGSHEYAVIGGGMVGLTAAISLSAASNDVALFSPESTLDDPRTTALLDDSINYLHHLGIWEHVKKNAHPLKIMRIIDSTNNLFRFGQTDFHASEIGLEAFGYNIRNADLLQALHEKALQSSNITLFQTTVSHVAEHENGKIRITFKSEAGNEPASVSVNFVVGADGGNSVVRNNFSPGVREWSYPQHAMVLDFGHTMNSGYISTEFHTKTGPFTIVPQSSQRAGLVWLETPERTAEICAMENTDLNLLLEEMMASCLGKTSIENRPRAFPVRGLVANCFGDRNFALIGEAAHVFPPIGAQGFNLGIRDVKDLIQVCTGSASDKSRGNLYHTKRLSDVNSRTIGVDLLNRSLLSGFLPVHIARAAGMFALGNIPLLRKQVMRMGIAPARMF